MADVAQVVAENLSDKEMCGILSLYRGIPEDSQESPWASWKLRIPAARNTVQDTAEVD